MLPAVRRNGPTPLSTDQNIRCTLGSGDSDVFTFLTASLKNIEEVETKGKRNQTKPKLLAQVLTVGHKLLATQGKLFRLFMA